MISGIPRPLPVECASDRVALVGELIAMICHHYDLSSLCSQLLSLLQHCGLKPIWIRGEKIDCFRWGCRENWNLGLEILCRCWWNQGLVGKAWEAGMRELKKGPEGWRGDEETAAVEEKMSMDPGQGEMKETEWLRKKQRQLLEESERNWKEFRWLCVNVWFIVLGTIKCSVTEA